MTEFASGMAAAFARARVNEYGIPAGFLLEGLHHRRQPASARLYGVDASHASASADDDLALLKQRYLAAGARE